MTTTKKAADLPDGSVVAIKSPKGVFDSSVETWVKRWQTPGGEWQNASGDLAGNWYIDERLNAGAQVLREGTA